MAVVFKIGNVWDYQKWVAHNWINIVQR